MSDLFFQCPKCKYSIADDLEPIEEEKDLQWAYTKTNDNNKWDAIKKSEIRMKKEFGYGIPEAINEDLGSCITGIWEEDENKKC